MCFTCVLHGSSYARAAEPRHTRRHPGLLLFRAVVMRTVMCMYNHCPCRYRYCCVSTAVLDSGCSQGKLQTHTNVHVVHVLFRVLDDRVRLHGDIRVALCQSVADDLVGRQVRLGQRRVVLRLDLDVPILLVVKPADNKGEGGRGKGKRLGLSIYIYRFKDRTYSSPARNDCRETQKTYEEGYIVDKATRAGGERGVGGGDCCVWLKSSSWPPNAGRAERAGWRGNNIRWPHLDTGEQREESKYCCWRNCKQA